MGKLCKKVEENNPELVESAKKAKTKVLEQVDSTKTELEQRHPTSAKSVKSAQNNLLEKVDRAKMAIEKRSSRSQKSQYFPDAPAETRWECYQCKEKNVGARCDFCGLEKTDPRNTIICKLQ